MHRFLKPKTIQWMKSKGELNESEAAELIADVEAYRQENERLTQIRYNATEAHVTIQSRQAEQIETLQQQLKQAIEALEYYADINIMRFERITAKEALSIIRQGGPTCISSE